MPHFALLISPLARAAYFGDVHKVALSEIAGLPDVSVQGITSHGALAFLCLNSDEALVPALLRLSFAQGLFRVEDGAFYSVEAGPGFALHEDFVSGEKYRGKTNETLTQLLLNLALKEARTEAAPTRLIDPMCGRGTSLFWAMRYGLSATGIEQDPSALNEIRRGLKK